MTTSSSSNTNGKPAAAGTGSKTATKKTAAASTASAAATPERPATKETAPVDSAHEAIEAVQHTVQTTQETASKNMEQALTMTREQTEKTTEEVMKSMEEMRKQQQGAMDAFMRSGTAFTKGVEELNRTWMGYMQNAFETNIEASNKMLGARTIREWSEIQQDAARKNFDELVGEMTKISEIGFKAASDCFEPLSEQMNQTMQRAGQQR